MCSRSASRLRPPTLTRQQFDANIEHARVEAVPSGSGALGALPLMLVYAAVILWAVWTRILPWWILAALPALSMMTFFAYWQDKYAAEKGKWRTPEGTLHLYSLAGGWPGAWFAQQHPSPQV